MAQGTQRREGAQDNLAGQAPEVTSRSAAPLSVPAVNTPDLVNSTSSRIANSLGQFSSQQFQNAANLQHEADALDGQMAYMQGQAMDEVEMDGNKWTLTGYRVMQAQSLSSSMLAAQQEMIAQADHQLDPEAFRAQIVNRMQSQIEGLDPQTARMVREQMASQLPSLVGQHTSAHLSYQEGQAYEALVNSVDILGKDETALETFLSNADGTGGSNGLSDARRTDAVADGIVRAFAFGNPLALSRLKRAGKMDQFSTAQINRMEAAEAHHQNKLRTDLNEEFLVQELELQTEFTEGRIDFATATAQYGQLMADHGMKMSQNEARSVGMEAQQHRETFLQGSSVMYQDAVKRGDWGAVAELSFDDVVYHESRGNPNARGPEIKHGANAGDRAQGAAQVMPKTIADPGYGIRPADVNDPVDVYRVGKEYWAAMVQGSAHPSGHFNWAPGDIEAAAIAYNAGPGNATKWVNAGRDYNALPNPGETKPYAQAIAKDATGSGRVVTAKERLIAAEGHTKAMNERLELNEYIKIEDAKATLSADLDAGNIDLPTYMQEAGKLLRESDYHFTQAQVNSVLNTQKTFMDDMQGKLDDVKQEQFDVDMGTFVSQKEAELDRAMNPTDADGNAIPYNPTEVARLTAELEHGAVDIMQKYGFTIAEGDMASITKKADAAFAQMSKDQGRLQVEAAVMNAAHRDGRADELTAAQRDKLGQKDRQEAETAVNNMAARGDLGPSPDQATTDQAIMVQEVSSWNAGGYVPPSQVARFQNIMRQEPLATDGNANPAMIEAVNYYAQMTKLNTASAHAMFGDNDAAIMMADEIIALGNGDFANGVQRYGESAKNLDLGPAGDPTPDFMEKVADNVYSPHTPTHEFWSDLWSGRSADTLSILPSEGEAREAEMERVNDSIMTEAARIQRLYPNFSAEQVARRASANVYGRVDFVGGEAIIANSEANSLRAHYFGESRNRSELDNGMAMHNMMVDYLSEEWLPSDPGNSQMLFGDPQTGVGAVLQDALGFIPGVGKTEEQAQIEGRGIPAFDVIVSPRPDGGVNQVFVQFTKPNGEVSRAIPIPRGYGMVWAERQKDRFK